MLKKIIINYLIKLKRKKIIIYFFVSCLPQFLYAEEKIFNSVYLDIPFIDAPSGSNKYNPLLDPSMQESLKYAKSMYHLTNYGLSSLFPEKNGEVIWYGALTVFAANALISSLPIPLFDVWLHEEWHRAVMTQRNISSHNGVYNFDFGSSTIPVDKVADEDLIRLKKDHPAEQVRLSAAGMEAQATLITELAKDKFYRNIKTFQAGTMILQAFSIYNYMSICNTNENLTMSKEELTDISKRDFTGYDCTAWVYDLFRPDEPYTARGLVPSGVGINRYINYNQLTEAEKRFLYRNKNLSLLNFTQPIADIFSPFEYEDHKFQVALSHYLTSFGDAIETNLFYKNKKFNLFAKIHVYENTVRNFLGITFESYDKQLFNTPFYFSPKISIWEQPANQRYDDKTGKIGILFGLKSAYEFLQNFQSYIEFIGKSEGWVAGEVNINSGLRTIAGLTYKF